MFLESTLTRTYSYCWYFRNPVRNPPFGCTKENTTVNHGMMNHYHPQLVSFLTVGFRKTIMSFLSVNLPLSHFPSTWSNILRPPTREKLNFSRSLLLLEDSLHWSRSVNRVLLSSEKIKPGVCYTVTPPNNKLTMEKTTTWRCNLLIKMVILHCH